MRNLFRRLERRDAEPIPSRHRAIERRELVRQLRHLGVEAGGTVVVHTAFSAQRRRSVGHTPARLARSRAIVGAVVERLRTEETTFLHPTGVDEECDEARRSLERAAAASSR